MCCFVHVLLIQEMSPDLYFGSESGFVVPVCCLAQIVLTKFKFIFSNLLCRYDSNGVHLSNMVMKDVQTTRFFTFDVVQPASGTFRLCLLY